MKNQKKIALSAVLLLALAACAETPDERFAKLKTEVPAVTGGFTYKQYVTVNPGDPEVLGDEGVLYISPTLFTDEQFKHIGESGPGKDALEMANNFPSDGLLNTCFSAVQRDKGKAGEAAGYSSLVITWTHKVKDGGVRFNLYSWPDAWYSWYLKRSGSQILAEDPFAQPDFGWQSSRIVLTPDTSVTLDSCLHYRDSATASIQQYRR